ncbi:hypothetical protein CN947_19045 [Bacillus cereus]|nr:hypothetical protein CN947_19045 [Bacillus cereus]
MSSFYPVIYLIFCPFSYISDPIYEDSPWGKCRTAEFNDWSFKSNRSKTSTIIGKVLILESLLTPVVGITITTIGVISASRKGKLDCLEGFQCRNNDVIIIATICILLIVFLIQWVSNFVTT